MTFADDDKPKPPASPRPGEDLAALSIDELKARIALYNAEIERLERDIAAKEKRRSDADAFFRR